MEHLYLIHHGIKGQEWGVQNGPPYPLDRKSQKVKKYAEKQIKRTVKLFGQRSDQARKASDNYMLKAAKNPKKSSMYKQKSQEQRLYARNFEKDAQALIKKYSNMTISDMKKEKKELRSGALTGFLIGGVGTTALSAIAISKDGSYIAASPGNKIINEIMKSSMNTARQIKNSKKK